MIIIIILENGSSVRFCGGDVSTDITESGVYINGMLDEYELEFYPLLLSGNIKRMSRNEILFPKENIKSFHIFW